MLFQHRLFVWKFSFKEKQLKQRTIKEKLRFQSMSLLAESYSLKLNRPWPCDSNLIRYFRKDLKKNSDRQVHYLSHDFLWGHFFTKTQSFHITLLNAITGVFMRIFWNSYTENFGKYLEKRIWWSSNTKLKIRLEILCWKCSEKKGNSKISKKRPNKSVPYEFFQETV